MVKPNRTRAGQSSDRREGSSFQIGEVSELCLNQGEDRRRDERRSPPNLLGQHPRRPVGPPEGVSSGSRLLFERLRNTRLASYSVPASTGLTSSERSEVKHHRVVAESGAADRSQLTAPLASPKPLEGRGAVAQPDSHAKGLQRGVRFERSEVIAAIAELENIERALRVDIDP